MIRKNFKMAQLSPQSGFSLVEAALAIAIAGFSILGLLKAFEYGGFFLEREGLRRQALGVVQSRLEELKHQSQFGKVDLEIRTSEEPFEMERMFFNQIINLPARMKTEVGNVVVESGLSYQDVNVSVIYKYQDIADTLGLDTRFYLWAGN